MFVYKLGKLYIRKDTEVVGVNYSPLFLDEVEGTVESFDDSFNPLEPFEVRAKFNVTEATPYFFPVESDEKEIVEEVIEDVPVSEEPVIEEIVEKKGAGRPKK